MITTAETCDRCPQQAAATVLTPAGPLAFCGHHARQYGPVFAARRYPVTATGILTNLAMRRLHLRAPGLP